MSIVYCPFLSFYFFFSWLFFLFYVTQYFLNGFLLFLCFFFLLFRRFLSFYILFLTFLLFLYFLFAFFLLQKHIIRKIYSPSVFISFSFFSPSSFLFLFHCFIHYISNFISVYIFSPYNEIDAFDFLFFSRLIFWNTFILMVWKYQHFYKGSLVVF